MDRSVTDPGSRVKWSEGGPFAITPLWVLTSDVSDRAKVLYAFLASRAGAEGSTVRGHGEISEWLSCGRTSVKNAIQELVDVGAVTVVERENSVGGRGWNDYHVHAVQATQPSRGGDHTPVAPAANREIDPIVEETTTSNDVVVQGGGSPTRPTWKVDRRVVSDSERASAVEALDEWNRQTGQSLKSNEWLAKVVMRQREHPDLTVLDHAAIIAAVLAAPWWKGVPSPSVVYGNAALFETSMERARAGGGGAAAALKVARDELDRMEDER